MRYICAIKFASNATNEFKDAVREAVLKPLRMPLNGFKEVLSIKWTKSENESDNVFVASLIYDERFVVPLVKYQMDQIRKSLCAPAPSAVPADSANTFTHHIMKVLENCAIGGVSIRPISQVPGGSGRISPTIVEEEEPKEEQEDAFLSVAFSPVPSSRSTSPSSSPPSKA